MDQPPSRASKLLPPFLRAAVLLAGAMLHWMTAEVIEILPDDILLMAGSRSIDSSAGSRKVSYLLAPQHIHVIPLYRLLRLPFDLHFPAWYAGLHALAVGAHLASALILFLLARRCLRSPWAALLTATLFAWSTVGAEGLIWKAASPFVFSWTFLLLAVWCLAHDSDARDAWAGAGAASLFCAVGMFSGALFAIPGVLLAVVLLEPRGKPRALWACSSALIIGAAAWLLVVPRSASLKHYWQAGGGHNGSPPAGLLTRLALAARDTVHSFGYQLGVGVRVNPEGHVLALLAAALLALLILRRTISIPWLAAALALTLPPLFVIMLIRSEPDVWKISRYTYQSYTFWAVTIGAAYDALLRETERLPRWRYAALLAALPMAAWYLHGNFLVARHHRDSFRRNQVTQREFWLGWDAFFRAASAHAVETGWPLRLPFLDAAPGLGVHVVYRLCEPRGLPGLIAEHAVSGSPEEQQAFWQEVGRTHAHLPGFSRHL